MKRTLHWPLLAVLSLIMGCSSTPKNYGNFPGADRQPAGSSELTWNDYGGIRTADRMGEKFSPLNQINPSNVRRLKPIWVYHTNERHIEGPKSLEVTPVYHDGLLYGCSIFNKVFALDPETGKEVWAVNPDVRKSDKVWAYKCRGVALWTDSRASGQVCSTRVISSTIDGRLLALDAKTGERCPDFVERQNGQPIPGAPVGEVAPWINVMIPKIEGDRTPYATKQKDHPWRDEYYITSAPLIFKDLIIIGGGIADNGRVDATAGAVQAFDVRTGELRWVWDPVPPALISSTLNSGTPNAWAPMSADDSRGLVFIPTGTAAPDYYAATRNGKDKYANSVVALRVAQNGRLLDKPVVDWHFKLTIQDKWDYDAPAQPVLSELQVEGRPVPVVIQPTKMGFIFIMDRDTGQPIFPTAKGYVRGKYNDLLKPVSAEGLVPGETLIAMNDLVTETRDGKVTFDNKGHGSHSPVQPFPPVEWQLHDTPEKKDDLMGTLSGFNKTCKALTAKYQYHGIFTPPSFQGSINFPGAVGGIDWGGVTVDPVNEILYVNQIRIATIAQMFKREDYKKELEKAGAHGPAAFKEAYFDMAGTPYGLHRFPYLDPETRLPCSDPPYGTLKAISLKNGRVLWENKFGDFATMTKLVTESEKKAQTGDMAAGGGFKSWIKKGIVKIHSFSAGVPNFGGSLATQGGILFIAAGADSVFRMYDSKKGHLLHQIDLNKIEGAGSGAATPMTFMSRGNKQIVVLASGGNKFIPGKHGDAIVGFAVE